MSNEGGDFAKDDDVDNELEGGDFTQDDDADDLMEHEEDLYESSPHKNRRPHSPSPTYLSSIWSHHPKTKHTRTRTSLSSDDSDQQNNLEDLNKVDIDNGRRHHTKKAKGAANNRDATNVGFCPSLWQKLLDCAKANFRLYIATSVPFPDKEQSIGSTRVCDEVIAKAIIQWQEQKCKLEKGYYPEFKTGMAVTVTLSPPIHFPLSPWTYGCALYLYSLGSYL
ncbi:hypothetical protein CY34DRAFT_18895 [Suillus luteus UH-Slu-Lm8-n1]|uniref:Uncharacterized protein n=1 Tax=Suillus luteus UH-Slu-Lm8-n1 TaxID=930992 RepID=A0A0D0AL66_9AGAM|nr:hypothetical protein CY34DRAFT_18895 [Suillus luteus UH-Slu-Lm8-n1]